MYDIVKLLHLVAGIVWMGGMTFMLIALRPAAMNVLEPQVRARLMGAVWSRFFRLVLIAVVVLVATGSHMYLVGFRALKESTGVGGMPLGWNLMLFLGLSMVLIFGHIYFAGFKRFQRAVGAAEWSVAAQAATQVQALVRLNFVLGWLAIAALRLLQ